MLLRQFVNYKAVPKTVTMIIQTRVLSVLGDRLYAIENKQVKTLCVLVFCFLWTDTMTMVTLIKENIQLGLACTSRSLVHYQHGKEHVSRRTVMVLENQQRVLHIDLQEERKSHWVWVSGTSKPTPSGILLPTSHTSNPFHIVSLLDVFAFKYMSL